MKFTKMQGIGNDYIYVNLFTETVQDPEALARRLSDRHFGIGGDGLVLIGPSDRADFRMTMYNADGSRGRMCGNAARCIGRYVHDHRMTDQRAFTLETDSGVRDILLHLEKDEVTNITVDMGAPVTDCEKVPCILGHGVVCRHGIRALGRQLEITPVSMGNPHGVIFLDEPVESFEVARYGRALETDPVFPEKANIEFANVLSRDCVKMRVWERGSGITLACGTGACAVFAAGTLCGYLDTRVKILLEGGSLVTEWKGDHILLTGGAEEVFEGEIRL